MFRPIVERSREKYVSRICGKKKKKRLTKGKPAKLFSKRTDLFEFLNSSESRSRNSRRSTLHDGYKCRRPIASVRLRIAIDSTSPVLFAARVYLCVHIAELIVIEKTFHEHLSVQIRVLSSSFSLQPVSFSYLIPRNITSNATYQAEFRIETPKDDRNAHWLIRSKKNVPDYFHCFSFFSYLPNLSQTKSIWTRRKKKKKK